MLTWIEHLGRVLLIRVLASRTSLLLKRIVSSRTWCDCNTEKCVEICATLRIVQRRRLWQWLWPLLKDVLWTVGMQLERTIAAARTSFVIDAIAYAACGRAYHHWNSSSLDVKRLRIVALTALIVSNLGLAISKLQLISCISWSLLGGRWQYGRVFLFRKWTLFAVIKRQIFCLFFRDIFIILAWLDRRARTRLIVVQDESVCIITRCA